MKGWLLLLATAVVLIAVSFLEQAWSERTREQTSSKKTLAGVPPELMATPAKYPAYGDPTPADATASPTTKVPFPQGEAYEKFPIFENQQGYDAFWEGKSWTDNPYDFEHDPARNKYWEAGWWHARNQKEDADDLATTLKILPEATPSSTPRQRKVPSLKPVPNAKYPQGVVE